MSILRISWESCPFCCAACICIYDYIIKHMCAVCMKWGMGSFSLATSICTYTYMIIRIICVHLVNKGGDGPFHLGYICICVFLYHSICPISAYDYIIKVCQSCVYLMHESDIELFLLRYMYILLHHTIYIICAPCE